MKMRHLAGAGALAAFLAIPAMAVGLAPLRKTGWTDGPAKAFWLQVSNPYAKAKQFRVYSTAIGSEAEGLADVDLPNPTIRVPAGRSRRVLVIVRELEPGESRDVRVCAELARKEGFINARVCSKLTARRIARGS